MRHLKLISMGKLLSWDFLRGCNELRSIVLGATKVDARACWDPVIEHGNLRELWVPSVSDEQIRAVSRANPNLCIANSSVYYVRAQEVLREYYNEMTAVERWVPERPHGEL